MTTPLSPQIAVVGSGPAGCYVAQSLLRALPDSAITIFDRLVSPFGLIRYGIAADHQHTKAITRQFERLFQSENVRFAGNIEIGRDVPLESLNEHFDAVVLATGLTSDRPLAVPGALHEGVIGAGTITRALNAHPDSPQELPALGSDVVIVGAGNVALDILRFLVKDASDYAGSDVADVALNSYLRHPAERVTIVSRSSAAEAKGDAQMLKELAALPRAKYFTPDSLETREGLDRAAAARLAAYAELTSPSRADHPGPAVTLRFGLTPTAIVGEDQIESIEFTTSSGATETIQATTVITAIGFDAEASPLTATLASSSETGRVAPGLYRTGWAKRGPRGAIPENRACAKAVADELAFDVTSGALAVTGHKRGFAALPAQVQHKAINFAAWQVLDAHERANAGAERIRRKIPDHTQMASVARGLTATHSS